jgi:hypothetical protein
MWLPRTSELRSSAEVLGPGGRISDKTTDELLDAMGLNWEVEQYPLVAVTGTGEAVVIDGMFANLRSTDHYQFGVVSQQWEHIFQNADALNMMRDVLYGEGFDYIRGVDFGKRIGIQIEMPSTIKVTGEEATKFLTYTSDKSGNGSDGFNSGTVVIVCSNTFNANMFAPEDNIRFPHRGSVPTVQDVRDALAIMVEADAEFESQIEVMLGISVSDKELLTVSDIVFGGAPDPFDYDLTDEAEERKYVNRRIAHLGRQEALLGITSGDTVNFPGTGWGALNAISEYVEHYGPGSDKGRAKKMLTGKFDSPISKARQEIMALA